MSFPKEETGLEGDYHLVEASKAFFLNNKSQALWFPVSYLPQSLPQVPSKHGVPQVQVFTTYHPLSSQYPSSRVHCDPRTSIRALNAG